MRDMVPRDDRSIRNIPVPATHHKRAPQSYEDEQQSPAPRGEYRQPPRPRGKGKRRLLILGVAIVIICAVGGLLLSTLFAGATITVYPREAQVAVPASLSAQPNAPIGTLSYEVMTVTRSASTTVQATGSKNVSRAASGTVTIYNSFGTETQRLIANTRFEAPDGKIYRVRDSVVVPGMKGTTPGTATVTVFADSAGASYNRSEKTRFTVPGFKGDPRYEKFYAETSSIVGGYVGPEPTVAAADLTKAREALQQGLAQAAQTSLGSQIPTGYLPVPGTLQVTYSEISQAPGQESTAILGQSATMSAAIVSQEMLASVIAKQTVQDYQGEPVMIKDPSSVIMSVASSTQLSAGRITIDLQGSPTLVWRYDSEKLVTSLLGKNKGEFESIIESFAPAIMRAEAKLRPFWDTSFPSEREKVKIEEGK
ncbi:MAG: hypothetical protein KBD50_03010 [Candidatus Pacebacteria bacterium]|nr:hypothetical protein [Candidatus Paceibacterota bacterium]